MHDPQLLMSAVLQPLQTWMSWYIDHPVSFYWLPVFRCLLNLAFFLVLTYFWKKDESEQAWRINIGLFFTAISALLTLLVHWYVKRSEGTVDLLLWLNSLFWLSPCAIILASISQHGHPAGPIIVFFAIYVVGVDTLLFFMPRTIAGLCAFIQDTE